MKNKFTRLLLITSLFYYSCKKEEVFIDPAASYTIPLKLTYANGRPVPSVMIDINGQIREVVFDTGSSGLRILTGGVNGSALSEPDDTLRAIFGSGGDKLITKGVLAGSYFSLENSPGTTSIRFMLIDSTGYTGENNGGLSPVSPTETTDPAFQNYSGVLGVGLNYKGDGVASPLAQMPGNGKYIVEFPKYGADYGSVIVNPNSSQVAGFTFYQLSMGNMLIPNGDNSWLDNAIKGTVQVNGVTLTNPILFDTGTSQMVLTTNLINAGTVQNGTVTYSLGTIESSFTIANPPVGEQTVQVNPVTNTDAALSNLGTRVFFDFDVLYDQVHGMIGLRKNKNAD